MRDTHDNGGVAEAIRRQVAEQLGVAGDDDLLRDRDVERWTQIPVGTLAQWRHRKIGPPYIRVGPRNIRYRRGDVRVWLAQQATG